MGHLNHPAATPAERASPIRVWLAIALALVLPAAILFVRPSFFSRVAEAMNLTPQIGAVAYLFAAATTEEVAKATAIGAADLKRSRLSWFWIAVLVAAIVGLTEVGLRVMMYIDRIGLDGLVLAGIRTISGHIALSLTCAALARVMGNWLVPVVITGALHALINYGGRATGTLILYDQATFVLFVAVIVAAYVWRSRLDWRVLT